MSEITNPPLGPGAAATSEHANATFDNPVLDQPGSGGSAAAALQNPPLDGGGGSAAAALQNPPLDGGGRSGADGAVSDDPPLSSVASGVDVERPNPSLDEADIERWFEQQLDQDGAAPPAKKAATKKASPRKTATKGPAKKRSTAAKPANKQAARRRSTSKGSRTR